MNSFIPYSETPTSRSESTFKVTYDYQKQIERIVRENYQLMDEMEPGQNYGAYPFGYVPVNTMR